MSPQHSSSLAGWESDPPADTEGSLSLTTHRGLKGTDSQLLCSAGTGRGMQGVCIQAGVGLTARATGQWRQMDWGTVCFPQGHWSCLEHSILPGQGPGAMTHDLPGPAKGICLGVPIPTPPHIALTEMAPGHPRAGAPTFTEQQGCAAVHSLLQQAHFTHRPGACTIPSASRVSQWLASSRRGKP